MNRDQWQSIVQEFYQSNLSKRAFADQHDLVYSQLLYWIRQIDDSQAAISPKPEDLIPLTIKPVSAVASSEPVLGTLEVPNGTSLRIHSTELLSLLPELLRV